MLSCFPICVYLHMYMYVCQGLWQYSVVLNITPDYVVVQVALTVQGEISDICMKCEYLKGDVFYNCSDSHEKR